MLLFSEQYLKSLMLICPHTDHFKNFDSPYSVLLLVKMS